MQSQETDATSLKPRSVRFANLALLAAFCGFFVLLALIPESSFWPPPVKSFNTVFQSILMEAFPFIFIGVFISALLHVFLSQDHLVRIFPKNRFAGLGLAAIAGLFLPVCDCAIVPIAGRLVKKGVPLPSAITFMLAAPIVDPVVIASTYYAFPGRPEIALYRVLIGVTVALSVGIILMLFPDKESPLLIDALPANCSCSCGDEHDHSHHEAKHRPASIALSMPVKNESTAFLKDALQPQKPEFSMQLQAVFSHAAGEFFAVGQFLVLGALISVAVQTFLPYEWLSALSGNRTLSVLVMMAAAFLLSICSTADAFIARSFSSTFSLGSVMGFMVAGALMDIKNYLMMSYLFRKRFILKVLGITYSIAFILLALTGTILP